MADKHVKPMNLVFMFSDQHSKHKFGCYGNEYIHTPNLDKMAAEGVLFENAYSTNPICVPARASMANGDYTHKHSYWDNACPFAGAEDSWGTRLVEQGFKVTTIGKLHYKDSIPETGFPDQRLALNVKDGIGDPTHAIRDGSMRRPFLRDEMLDAGVGDSDYLKFDANVASQAAEYIRTEGKASEKPFCLFVGFVCPHFPWKVPQDIMDLYTPYDKLPFPLKWHKGERDMHPALEEFRREFCMDGDISDEDVRKAVASYYGMITYVDRQAGTILDAIKEAGLDENTRVIYCDDHGDTTGDHGLFFKHSMYEGSVGIPMLVSGPDLPKGKRVKQGVSLIDIFPTVIDCVGAEFKEEDAKLPGTSLWKFANGECTEDRPVFSEYHAIGFSNATYMLRYGAYKLVYYVGHPAQMFNLEDDPQELVNLVDQAEYQDVLAMMKEKLLEICDPEEVNAQAKREQAEMLAFYGGKEKTKEQFCITVSPVPEGSV